MNHSSESSVTQTCVVLQLCVNKQIHPAVFLPNNTAVLIVHLEMAKSAEPCDGFKVESVFCLVSDLHVPVVARSLLHPQSEDPPQRPEASELAHQLPGRTQAG